MNSSNSYLGRKRGSPEKHTEYSDRRRDNNTGYKYDNNSHDHRKSKDYDIDNRERYSSKNHRKPSYSPEDRERYSRRQDSYHSRSNRDNYNNKRNEDYHYEKRYQRRKSLSDDFDDSESSSLEADDSREMSANGKKLMKKKYNFLICLPRNFFRFIEQGYDSLWKEVIVALI
jgi:hypothetical protein